MSLPRLKSNRERRNLSVDANIVASAMPLRSPAMRASQPPTDPSSHVASSYSLLSPRNLPASVDREASSSSSTSSSIGDGGAHHVKASSACYLAYGMVVSWMSIDRSGLLASEGLNTSELRMEPLAVHTKHALDAVDRAMTSNGQSAVNVSCQLVSTHFKDCLFEVLPKMSYDAAIRFHDARAPSHHHQTDTTDAAIFADLKFKCDSELRLNSNIYQKLHGTTVKYGQVIQLRHIKSGLFVSTASATTTAADCVEVQLSSGSSSSHFTVMPRFKLRKAGEPVQLIDQVVLTSADKVHKMYSLYVSNRKASAESAALVMASSSFTSQWRVVPFDVTNKHVSTVDKYQQDFSQGLLKAGHCVRLFHLELSSWLGGSQPRHRVCLQATMDNPAAAGDQHLPSPQRTTVLDDPNQMLSPTTLWEVERTTSFQGGVLTWSHHIYLRHVVTGLYLAVAAPPPPLGVSSTTTSPDATFVCLQREPEPFVLCPTTLGDSRSSVGLHSAVQLLHLNSSRYIHASSQELDHLEDERLADDVDERRHISTCRVTALADAQDQDAFKIVPVSQAEMDNTLVLVSYKSVFDRFVAYFRDPPTAPPADSSVLFAQVCRALDGLKRFTVSDAAQGLDHMTVLRQALLWQHRYVALLTDMLQAPFALFGGPFTLDYVSSFYIDKTHNPDEIPYDVGGIAMTLDSPDKKSNPQKDGSTTASEVSSSVGDLPPPLGFRLSLSSMHALNHVICEVNVLLFRIFYSSRAADAASCRRAMPVLVQFLGHQFLASVPLAYLIQEKLYLSESSLASFSLLIRHFLHLIKTKGKSARYLQFLVVLCSEDGHAIPKIQEKICELLFNPVHGYAGAVLLESRPLPSGRGFEICIPPSSPHAPDDGQGGGSWTPMNEFYEAYYEHGHHATLAPYFYGLLQLYSALCLDRNYTCIHSLKDKFPRSCLLATVQDSTLSRSIRAVLLNLLLVVHVDCEPLKPVPSPNYTRIWKDVDASSTATKHIPMAQDVWYTAQDWLFFDDLRELVVGQLRKTDGRIVIAEFPHNTMLLAVLRTCKKLVECGLFRTLDTLSQLVQHLVRLLDCRTDSLSPHHPVPTPPTSKSFRAPSDGTMAVSPVFQRSSESTRFDLNAQNDIIHHTQGNMLDEGIRRDSIERQYSSRPSKRVESKSLNDHDLRPRMWTAAVRDPSRPQSSSSSPPSQFKMTKWNQVVMEIKDEVCAILLHIDTFRLDHQISTVLGVLASSKEPPTTIDKTKPKPPPPSSWWISTLWGTSRGPSEVQETPVMPSTMIADTFALSSLAHRPLDTILLQALMYEHPPLVSKALELLLQQFNQHDQVIKALNNVLLIVDEHTVQNYDKLKTDMDRLRQLAETTEVWMDLTSTADYDVADHVCQLLHTLTAALNVGQDASAALDKTFGEGDATTTRAAPVAPPVQRHSHHPPKGGSQVETKRLLRNLDAMQTVINMLRDGSHFFKMQFPSSVSVATHPPVDTSSVDSPHAHQSIHCSVQQQQRAIRRVFSHGMTFLLAMCVDNVVNQSFLADHVASFVEFVDELPEAQALIAAIYTHHMPLCKSVPVKVLSAFMSLLVTDVAVRANKAPNAHQPPPIRLRFAAFLRAIVHCHGVPVVDNQTLVLSQILQSPTLLAFFRRCHGIVFKHLHDDDDGGGREDAMVETFAIYTEWTGLVVACARGKDMRLKLLCAGVTPFDQVLSLLEALSSRTTTRSSRTLVHGRAWLHPFEAGVVGALNDIYLTCDAFNEHPLDDALLSRLLHTVGTLVVQSTCSHVLALASMDSEASLTTPKPYVIFDGGNVYVDVTMASYKGPLASEVASHSFVMVFTLLLPALHLMLMHHHAAALGKDMYASVYVMLAMALTMPTVNALSADDQDVLLEVLRVLDKQLTPMDEAGRGGGAAVVACGLEMLFYDVSSRTKRPFLGNVVANDDLSPLALIQKLYDTYGNLVVLVPPGRKPAAAIVHSATTAATKKLSVIHDAVLLPPTTSPIRKSKGGSTMAASWWSWPGLHAAKKYFVHSKHPGQAIASSPRRTPRQKQLDKVIVVATASIDHEAAILDRYLASVQRDGATQHLLQEELHHMIRRILSVETAMKHESETISDLPKTTTTLDDIILRLVEHFKLLKYSKLSKVSVILLDVFSQMINSQDLSQRHAMQVRLNHLGLTSLVVTIVSSTTDPLVFDRCVALGIALLDGMNAKVQDNFYDIWVDCKATRFFDRIKHRIDKATDVMRRQAQVDDSVDVYASIKRPPHRQNVWTDTVMSSFPSSSSSLTDPTRTIVHVFRFLQLLCEGHVLKIQRVLLAQPLWHGQVNLVEATTTFLLEVHSRMTSPNLTILKQLFDTVTEFCQGPCLDAQECVANYKFISAVNELLVVVPPTTGNADAIARVRLLKGSVVIALLSLIEGRTDAIIHDRLVTELNFDTIKDNLVQVHAYFLTQYDGTYDGNSACSTDAYLTMGFNLHILMQHLKQHQPQLAQTVQPKVGRLGQEMADSDDPQKSSCLTWLGVPRRTAAAAAKRSHAKPATSLADAQKDVLYAQAYRFFQDKCGRVEILWRRLDDDDNSDDRTKHDLVHMYFPVHPICFCLTERSKARLKATINTDGDGTSKLADFFSRMPTLLHEMEYHSQLLQRRLITRLAVHTTSLRKLSFVLALALNCVVLMTFRALDSDTDPVVDIRSYVLPAFPDDGDSEIHAVLRILGTCQVILCSILFVLYAVHTAPPLVMDRWYQRKKLQLLQHKRPLRAVVASHVAIENRFPTADTRHDHHKRSLTDVEDLTRLLGDRVETTPPRRHPFSVGLNIVATMWVLVGDAYMVYSGLLVVFSILGTVVHPLFFAFHLLDVVNRSQDLKNVLKAIVYPGRSLLLLVALYILVVYIFAVVGFYFFRPDYTPERKSNPDAPLRCSTLFLCFLTTLDEGFKQNGGLGGFLVPRERGTDPLAYQRMIYDLLYNVILIIILVNISFGLIVDTFATIRTSHKDKLDGLHDRCFICSIDGYTFDRLTARGFHFHTHMEHNMWHYLCLFVHINKKPVTEYDGMELALAMQMARFDVTFFPNHRAMALERTAAQTTGDVWRHDDGDHHPSDATDDRPTASQLVRPTAQRMGMPGDHFHGKGGKGLSSPHLGPASSQQYSVEKTLNDLVEHQVAMRARQNEMEALQRQLAAAQDSMMQLLTAKLTTPPMTLQNEARPSRPNQFTFNDTTDDQPR